MGWNASVNKNSSQSQAQSGPWQPQQPFLKDLFGQAQNLFNQGPQQFYPGSTVNPLNQTQQSAIAGTAARGQGGSATEGAFNSYLQNSLGSQGPDVSGASGTAGQFAQAGQQGLNTLGRFAAGGNRPGDVGAAAHNAAPSWNPMSSLGGFSGPGGGQAGSRQLDATARGDYLGSNPFLDSAYDRAANRVSSQFNETVLPGINTTFGGAGRAGSPSHERSVQQAAGGLGESLSDLGASIYAPAYEAERGRQFSAGSQQAGYQDASFGRQFAGGQADQDRRYNLFNAERQRQFGGQQAAADRSFTGSQSAADRSFAGGESAAARQLAAAQGLGGFGLGGADLQGNLGLGAYDAQTGRQQGAGAQVPSASALDYQNLGAVGQAGSQLRDQADRELQGNVDRFDFNQQAPWANLARYFGIAGNPVGTSNSTGQSRGFGAGAGVGNKRA